MKNLILSTLFLVVSSAAQAQPAAFDRDIDCQREGLAIRISYTAFYATGETLTKYSVKSPENPRMASVFESTQGATQDTSLCYDKKTEKLCSQNTQEKAFVIVYPSNFKIPSKFGEARLYVESSKLGNSMGAISMGAAADGDRMNCVVSKGLLEK